MSKLRLIKNYKENEQLRESFFALANDVFGLDFARWYTLGFLGEDYTSFSFENENKIIANISLAHTDFMIQGIPYRALQMGTVMIHPDYRNKGLAKKLMTHRRLSYAG